MGKRLDEKANVNFKVYGQTGQRVTTIHMLLDISRSKVNQTMKFGQLIKYNMRNIVF